MTIIINILHYITSYIVVSLLDLNTGRLFISKQLSV